MDSLVLDIGGTVGALVIHAGAELAEREIEISPVGAETREHNVVHARRGPGETVYTAVFPTVPAGEYSVWGLDGAVHAVVRVRGGEVTEHQM